MPAGFSFGGSGRGLVRLRIEAAVFCVAVGFPGQAIMRPAIVLASRHHKPKDSAAGLEPRAF